LSSRAPIGMIDPGSRVLGEFGEALSLACRLQRAFSESDNISLAPWWVVVRGSLDLAHEDLPETGVAGPLSVYIPADWAINPPHCFSEAVWLRRDIDWHVGADGQLCWVLPDEWAARNSEVLGHGGISVLKRYSSFWLLRNVKYLLTCHHVGRELGLVKWPASWPQYAHFQRGRMQFQKAERRRRIRREMTHSREDG